MLGCVAVAGVLVALLPRGRDALLAMAAMALTLPAMLDALLLPRFRSLGGKPRSLEAPGVAYFIGVGLALAMLLGVALRVVARAQGGALVKTGEDSLLLFAVAPGRDVAATLRQLRWREQLGIALAGAGAAGLLLQLVRALVRVAQG